MPAAYRVDLLRVQPQRAGEREQLLAKRPGARELADLDQRRDEPERADRERPLLAAEAVVGLVDAVAQDQAVLGELVGDRQHGLAHPLVASRAGSRTAGSAAATRPGRPSRSAGRSGPLRRRRARRPRRLISSATGSHSAARSVSPRSRASLTPRSSATQHITFEAVKCLGSPRTSQIPRSGSRHSVAAWSTRPAISFHASGGIICEAPIPEWIAIESRIIPQTSCWRWS